MRTIAFCLSKPGFHSEWGGSSKAPTYSRAGPLQSHPGLVLLQLAHKLIQLVI